MPRWNPIPSALCHEQPTEFEKSSEEDPKTNGYIFKRHVDGINGGTRHVPKICRVMPAYPKTYGLSCDRRDCQHCHPETAGDFNSSYYRPHNWWIKNRWRSYYGYHYYPAPGSCVVGRKGCTPHKMIRMRLTKGEGAAKDETRRRATRIEQAIEEEQDEKAHDKTQRLSKWETSTFRPIDEGYELAMSEDIVLPTDDWKTETGDIQLAILASLGLLDDYEAEDADITLNSLPRNEDLYTIKYKSEKKRPNIPRDHELFFDDDEDWEFVIRSPSEGSMDWIMLDE